jgi:formiminoglutamase
MEKIIPFFAPDLAKVTNHRSGEIKFGERMLTVPVGADLSEFIKECPARFVLFGIPEDIGVRANFGRPGAASAWKSAISSIANIQYNSFCRGKELLVLGQLDVSAEMEEVQQLDFHVTADRKKMNELVERIDKEVTHIVTQLVRAGKIPIVIGGGHNNAYGMIKGTALAKGQAINAINFDAHSDFRILEGRHSGNGFSYAFEEGFLQQYFVFGLHENYTSKKVLITIKDLVHRVRYNTYDEIAIRGVKKFETELLNAERFITGSSFGIELDLDAIPNIASSAMTLSGFSVEQARQYIHRFGKNQNASYLHICEGAPELGDEKNQQLVGKLIGYLVTDFMKANSPVDKKIQNITVNW